MEHYLDDKNNIHFHFEQPIIHNVKDLYFKYDPNIEIINKCYSQYYDEKKIMNKRYIFRGFYKDGYFLIIIDIIDLNLNNIVYDKKVIIVKLTWHLVKINDELTIHKLDIKENSKHQYFLMNIRNSLKNNNDVHLDDIIFSNKKDIHHLIINKKNLKNFFNIKSLLSF